MSALLILNYDVTDPESLDNYRTAATPVLLGPAAGTLIASSDQTVSLPEAPKAGSHTVVLRFESEDAARRTYDSAEYRPLLDRRLASTAPHAALIVPDANDDES